MTPCAASRRPLHVGGHPGLGAKSLDVGRAEAGHNAGMTGGVRIDAERGLASSSRSGRRRPFAYALQAVAALQIEESHTANRAIFTARVGGRLALDMVKNLLGWRLEICDRHPIRPAFGRPFRHYSPPLPAIARISNVRSTPHSGLISAMQLTSACDP